ncbi:MAG: hypothetical protein JWM74_6249 [Myxococcaceae bacterium]|jgi:hypothetical protein|nr:hypothetical protein [Myxococcaceae bacterium]
MRFLHAPILAAALAILATACHSAPTEDANNLVLRTYDVPKGSARAVVSTLGDTFWMGENKLVGRASITPDGRLAVLATQNVQEGVQTLIDEITKHPPTYEQSIELHYFVLLGKPAAGPQPPPAGVSEIQPAIDEIVRTQGPQTFTVAERMQLSSLNGDNGKAETEQLRISQKAAQTNEGVDARVEIQFAKNDKLETRVHLVADRIVVLGATSQHSDAGDGSTLYYVVRVAPRADGKRP